MKKNKLKSIYFIKAICALGIILFHFSCHAQKSEFLPFYKFANGDWGAVFVAVFFMVSGGILYYNYSSSKIKLKDYYLKRWKSIFPMFYISYFFFEILYMIANKSIFYRGNPLIYIFTLLGIDGYLCSVIPTYYILGEWFIGMIIILYILFPIVLYFFRKNDKVTFISILLLYIIFLDKPIINPSSYCSITSSLFSFAIGMTLIKYKEKILNTKTLFISIVGILLLTLIKIPISIDLSYHLLGIFIFIFLFEVGKYIMQNKFLDITFKKIGELSYAIFLLQHLTINNVLNYFSPVSTLEAILTLIIIIIFTLCGANILTIVTNFIVNKVSLLKNNKKEVSR